MKNELIIDNYFILYFVVSSIDYCQLIYFKITIKFTNGRFNSQLDIL